MSLKKMRRICDITVEDAVADLSPSRPPPGMPYARWAAGMPRGRREGKQVPWYRGHQAGIHDSYLTLKTKYPRIAEEFRRCVGIEKNGSYRL